MGRSVWSERHLPVNVGARYSGNHSQTKIAMNSLVESQLGVYEEWRRHSPPEETNTLLLLEDGFSSVQGVKKLNGGQQVGEDDVGRVNQEGSHETSKSVTHELRPNEGENSNGRVGLDVVVQVVRSEDGDGEGRVCSGGRHDDNSHML